MISFTGLAGAQELKIAYIDPQILLNDSLAGKDVVSKIEKFRQEKQTVIQDQEADIKKLGEEISAKSLTMTQEAKDKKELEYQKKIKEFNRVVKDSQDELEEKYNVLLKPVKETLDEIINDYGKKNGFDIILDVRRAGVVYASDRIDITKDILKIYDDTYQAKAKKGTK
jgi:outer membrane protein